MLTVNSTFPVNRAPLLGREIRPDEGSPTMKEIRKTGQNQTEFLEYPWQSSNIKEKSPKFGGFLYNILALLALQPLIE